MNITQDNFQSRKNELVFYGVSFLVLLLYFLPYFIWGQDCIIRIGDNLDGNIPYFKIFAENAHRFGWNYNTVPQVMDGLPKSSFLPQWNVVILLFYFFPPFTAYVIHLILIASIAFFGMLLLLKQLWNGSNDINRDIIIFGTALCFSLLDFYPSAGISIAGQPLLLFSFINISKGNYKFWNFLIILLFPFYSSLVFAGVIIFIILGLWGLYKIIKDRNHIWAFIGAGALLAISYIFTEQALIFNYLNQTGPKTIADIHIIMNSETLTHCIKDILKLLVAGLPSHANVFMFPIILFTIGLAIFLALSRRRIISSSFLDAILLTLVFAVLSGLYHWSMLDPIKKHIPFFRSFDFSRFSFFLPTLFYLLFFFSLEIINKTSMNKIKFILIALILLQVGILFKRNGNNKSLYYEIHKVVSYNRKTNQELSYREYYSESLFDQVKFYVNKNPSDYKVIALGLEPAILLYNGFYTLDGYNSNYPAAYRTEFRKIIEKEIEKSDSIKLDFETEGSLCYLFSAELTRGMKYTKLHPAKINHLEINTQQIKKLGGEYIISAVKINNNYDLGISLEKVFESPKSLYTIYLYKLL